MQSRQNIMTILRFPEHILILKLVYFSLLQNFIFAQRIISELFPIFLSDLCN